MFEIKPKNLGWQIALILEFSKHTGVRIAELNFKSFNIFIDYSIAFTASV